MRSVIPETLDVRRVEGLRLPEGPHARFVGGVDALASAHPIVQVASHVAPPIITSQRDASVAAIFAA